MRFEDLYFSFCNLNKDSNVDILEEGKMPVRAKLEDIYDEIYDRQVIWFSLENGYIIIKLMEE